MVSPEGETPAFSLASFTSVCFDIPEVMNMSKHMTTQDRQDISAGLKAGDSFGSIARKIGKSATTISREIRSHRIVWDKKPYVRVISRCANRQGCRLRGICNSNCNRLCSICGACTKKCSLNVCRGTLRETAASVLRLYSLPKPQSLHTGEVLLCPLLCTAGVYDYPTRIKRRIQPHTD
jgi:uncharacterized protein YerC